MDASLEFYVDCGGDVLYLVLAGGARYVVYSLAPLGGLAVALVDVAILGVMTPMLEVVEA